MHAITYALLKAVTASDAYQRQIAQQGGTATHPGLEPGLQPLAKRPSIHQAYGGAEGTDLHVSLQPGAPELVGLFMELVNSGLCPPAGLVSEGADVILSPGRIDLIAGIDKGNGSWNARLERKTWPPSHPNSVRGDGKAPEARWTEEVI